MGFVVLWTGCCVVHAGLELMILLLEPPLALVADLVSRFVPTVQNKAVPKIAFSCF